jgi:hypothetical protein
MKIEYDLIHFRFKKIEQRLLKHTQERNNHFNEWVNTALGKAYQTAVFNVSRTLFDLIQMPHDPKVDICRAQWFFNNIAYLTGDFFAKYHVDAQRDTDESLQHYLSSLQKVSYLQKKLENLRVEKDAKINAINAKRDLHLAERTKHPLPKAILSSEQELITSTMSELLSEASRRVISCQCGHLYKDLPWIETTEIHGQFKEDGSIVYSCTENASNKRHRH